MKRQSRTHGDRADDGKSFEVSVETNGSAPYAPDDAEAAVFVGGGDEVEQQP